jgi:hypothetical protein
MNEDHKIVTQLKKYKLQYTSIRHILYLV